MRFDYLAVSLFASWAAHGNAKANARNELGKERKLKDMDGFIDYAALDGLDSLLKTPERRMMMDEFDALDLDLETGRVPYIPSCGPPVVRDVIIVGAGLAGLAAGYKFGQLGISYRIIEGLHDVGGRVRSNSEWFDNPNYVEEGANWFYGEGDGFLVNPIGVLARRYNVSYFDQLFGAASIQAIRGQNGEEFPPPAVRRVLRNVRMCSRLILDRQGDAYFESWADNFFYTQVEDMTAEEMLAMAEGCNFTTPLEEAFVNYWIESESSLPLPRIGKATFPEYSFFDFRDGGSYFVNGQDGGYQRIAQDFATEFGMYENTDFRTKCKKVWYGKKDEPVVIDAVRKTRHGSFCTQKYKGKYAVVTSSVGVIRKNPSVFHPNLDLSTFPMFMVDNKKWFFQFEDAFWNTTKQHIIIGVRERGDGTCTWFLNYDYVDMNPGSRVLLCFSDDDEVKALEGLTPTETVDRLLSGLKSLPGYKDPIRIRTTSWEDNKFTEGAWESWRVGGTYEEYLANIKPRGRLYLAGSAFCLRYWGFTYGAWLSGIYNADLIDIDMQQKATGSKEHIHPYNPCFDLTVTRRPEWRKFYFDNPIIEEPYCPPESELLICNGTLSEEEDDDQFNPRLSIIPRVSRARAAMGDMDGLDDVDVMDVVDDGMV